MKSKILLKDGYQAHLDDAFALENFRKPPKTVGDFCSLLGFLGYYKDYVKIFQLS